MSASSVVTSSERGDFKPKSLPQTVAPMTQPLPQLSSPLNSKPSELLEVATTEEAVSLPWTPSNLRAVFIIATLTGAPFTSAFSIGLLTIGIPTIAVEISLAEDLLLWPASAYALTCGCSLLIAGTIADLVGSRRVFLAGCFALTMCNLACGLSRTGTQLIIFRAFQGTSVSLCFPTAGLGLPLGFAFGLVFGGLLVSSADGWRTGFYLLAGLTLLIFLIGIWTLPKDRLRGALSWRDFRDRIDWIGAGIASASLSIISYILATITSDPSNMAHSLNIVLLCVAVLLLPVFIFWMDRQERIGNPALIPNKLWRNFEFTTICLMVMLAWAILQPMEWFMSLFYQKVQGLSSTEAGLRFLPDVILGVILNITTGFLVQRVDGGLLVVATSTLSAGAPLIMAVINPAWSYWYAAFWAVLLGPFSVDVLYTVSTLVIVSNFPSSSQALAGAVFSTLAQLGTSLGLAILATISSASTNASSISDKTSPAALMAGYRVVFWTGFGTMLVTVLLGLVGLRRIGKVGIKKEE